MIAAPATALRAGLVLTSLAGQLLANTMRTVILCLAPFAALPALAQGTLTGHVREPSGFGVAGAEVRIAGSTGILAITDASGAFRVQGLPAGLVKLAARRIGFRPGTNEVTIADGQTMDVVIAVELAPVQLEEVRVTERRQPYDSRLVGFNQRMQKKVGTFITRERIDASASTSFSDLLRGVPGLHFVASNAFRNAVRFRGQNCPPLFYVDGFAAGAGEFDVDIIDPATVEGIEIYTGMLTVPQELAAPRGLEHCGVIAVWSRPFRPPPRPRKTVSRAELQRMVETAAIFTADEVESIARLVPGTFTPFYPDSLWRTSVDGETLVEFVVDGLGRVDMQFFSVSSASNPAFAESVREALFRARFVPAIRGGRHVRQLVRLPTRFEHPKP